MWEFRFKFIIFNIYLSILSVAQLAEHQTVELSRGHLRVTGSIPVAEIFWVDFK